MAAKRESDEKHEEMVTTYRALKAMGDRLPKATAISELARAMGHDPATRSRENGLKRLKALHRRGAVAFDGFVKKDVPWEKCEFVRLVKEPELWVRKEGE
jgi:hypothetical protein